MRTVTAVLSAALLSSAVLGAGCIAVGTPPGPGGATASALATAAPSITPPAASSAVATPPAVDPTPPSNLHQAAIAKGDGIRIRIELAHNPLVAGERNRVDVTVTNTGRDVMTWFHGCEQPAFVDGESQVAWDAGHQLAPQGQMFKQYALGTYNGQPLPSARIRFVPEDMLGKGSYGCADIGITGEILGPLDRPWDEKVDGFP